MLSVSLDCPFFIALFVFSNVYFLIDQPLSTTIPRIKKIVSELHISFISDCSFAKYKAFGCLHS